MVREPSALERLWGALLAFRTDLEEWEPHDDCAFCGATTFRDDTLTDYRSRCFNCGATGAGGHVHSEVD